MKNLFASVKLVKDQGKSFPKFSENDILSSKSMNCIRGGDGGEDVWSDPPPPKP
jgi:hypothetical protein